MSIIDQRYENKAKQRYYRIIISQDMFGDWVITRVWGGIDQASGRMTHQPCVSYEDAILEIEAIAKIRKRRGYELIAASTH